VAKRFTDTEKWKKPFIRGLQGPYKLLWFYILDDCDHAGIWQVDFEVARIRTGEQIDKQSAINAFGDRIEIFSEGSKWFLRDFIEFQYGQLNEKNRMHLSVINILTKNKIGPYKGLTSPQGKGTIQGHGNGQEQGPAEILNEDWLRWGEQIVNGENILWDKKKGRKITKEEMAEFLSVAVRNTWVMNTEMAFAISLEGFKSTSNHKNGTFKTGIRQAGAQILGGENYQEPL
jgi:hypothetical protein